MSGNKRSDREERIGVIPSFESFEAFCQHFNTEAACVQALFDARWPDGFRCPHCSHPRFSTIRTRRLPLYECLACGHQTSIISGTIMQGSSTKLTRWFQAMFLMAQPGGISAIRLAEIVQVTYKTAWLIAHKIRHAMQQANSQRRLEGTVRIQCAFYGYFSYFDARQPLIIGATMDSQHQPLHLKIEHPQPNHVMNNSRTITESGILQFVDRHLSRHANLERPRPVTPYHPLIRVRKALTKWLNQTYQGIGAKHLQAYSDEYAYRYNLQTESKPVFPKLLHGCAAAPVLIYRELIRHRPVLPIPWIACGGKNKWKGRYLSIWSVHGA